MDGELSDVDEGILVGEGGVEGQHLHHRLLHEVDHRQHGGRGELAVAHVRHVHLLSRKKAE